MLRDRGAAVRPGDSIPMSWITPGTSQSGSAMPCPPGGTIRETVSLDAVAGFPGIFWVVDSAMDYTAIPAAGGHAELGILLDQENIPPAARERFRNRAADNAPSDDETVDLIHGSYSSCPGSSKKVLQSSSRASLPSWTAN
jgi:hypothetical protein